MQKYKLQSKKYKVMVYAVLLVLKITGWFSQLWQLPLPQGFCFQGVGFNIIWATVDPILSRNRILPACSWSKDT